MTPAKISAALRRVATRLEKSRSPNRATIVAGLRLIHFAAMGLSARQALYRVAAEEEGFDIDTSDLTDIANILWENPEGENLISKFKGALKEKDDEKLLFQLDRLMTQIKEFKTSIKDKGGTTREKMKKEEEEGDVVTSAPPMKRAFRLPTVAARVAALMQPLTERNDYGTGSNTATEMPDIDEDAVGEECEVCGGPATHLWGHHFICDNDTCLDKMDTPERGSEWEMG